MVLYINLRIIFVSYTQNHINHRSLNGITLYFIIIINIHVSGQQIGQIRIKCDITPTHKWFMTMGSWTHCSVWTLPLQMGYHTRVFATQLSDTSSDTLDLWYILDKIIISQKKYMTIHLLATIIELYIHFIILLFIISTIYILINEGFYIYLLYTSQ